jgi:hypothetical protein
MIHDSLITAKFTNHDNPSVREAYRKGLLDGIYMFAFMKDGVSYVGTCGNKLQDAFDEVNETLDKCCEEVKQDKYAHIKQLRQEEYNT